MYIEKLTKFYCNYFGKQWPMIFNGLQSVKQISVLENKNCSITLDIRQEKIPFNLKCNFENLVSPDGLRSCNLSVYIADKHINTSIWNRLYDHLCSPIHGDFNRAYFMDLASLLPVIALNPLPNDHIADLCAAPGGKSIAISQGMSGQGALVANEINRKRCDKLEDIMMQYIPQSLVRVTNKDGRWFTKHFKGYFDKILLDAQCSGERHLILSDFKYSGWSVKKSKQYSNNQVKLLVSAIEMVRIGGCVVYSTCSISPFENDFVIQNAIKMAHELLNITVTVQDTNHLISSFGDDVFYDASDFLSYGNLVVPTLENNWGPIYFCKLIRVS